MATPTIIWTALPNGFDADGIPKISLYASFRLEDPNATTLEDYTKVDTPGLGNWPTTIQTIADSGFLSFVFSDDPTLPLPAAIDTSQLEPDLWTLLFPGTTLVRPHQFQDHAQRRIRSFSANQVHTFIDKLYNRVANASPRDFPDLLTNADLNDLATSWGTAIGRLRGLNNTATALVGLPGSLLYPPPTPASTPGGTHPDIELENELQSLQSTLGTSVPLSEFFRTYRFYNRGQLEDYRPQHEPVVTADIPPPPDEPTFDFHQVISMLGDHPLLLRKLGLVIDCAVPRASAFITPQQTSEGEVRASFAWPGTNPAASPFADKTPWTSYRANSAGFLARPAGDSDLRDGMLQLGNTNHFDVFQHDIDGGALKVLDFATNLGLVLTNASNPVCPPAETPTAPESVPALRNGGLTVARRGRDDALYQLLVSARDNNTDPGNAVLFADDINRGYRVDILFRGNWFSLCRRQMAYSVMNGSGDSLPLGDVPEDEGYVKAASGSSSVKDPPGSPGGSQDLYVHEGVFGWDNWSLVAPRPGRAVTHDRFETDSTQTYGRREMQPNADYPIAFDTSVVRYSLPALRFGESYQIRARAVDLAGNSHPYNVDENALSGSWTSKSVTYRRYEPVANPVLVLRRPLTLGESVERIVIRSKVGKDAIAGEKTLFNADNERHVAPPKISQMTAELHGAFDALFKDPSTAFDVASRESGTFSDPGSGVELIDASGASVDTAPLKHRGDPLPNGSYVIHTEAQLTLPYLPDPLAVGAAFDGLDGDQIAQALFEGGDSWPDFVPFRFIVEAGSTDQLEYKANTPFKVSLPKATILTLRYSSSTTKQGRQLMARYSSMSSSARSATEARDGQHWMLSPHRELTLVHAVEKPMKDPELDTDLIIDRGVGDTFVSLRGHLLTHSRSTSQADVYATWSDPVDRLHDDGPTQEDREGRVFEQSIRYAEDKAPFPGRGECVQQVRHEFGDRKHRWVNYYVVGTTRYREYFPPEVTDKPELITRKGPALEHMNIPSSARPAPPKVLYIVPTFRWERSDKKSVRRGRGLRIYLDRPWYSSGDDELLGVVVRPSGILLATQWEQLKPYVSEWGADPVWDDKGPREALEAKHFVTDPNAPDAAPTFGDGMKLAELPADNPLSATVVGFKPTYSMGRHAYTVDIELDPGNHDQTFVRLALARYQPYSLAGVHLSPVVRTEFAQLLADRTATLSYDQDTALEITLAGVMPKNKFGHVLPPSAAVQFSTAPQQTVAPDSHTSATAVAGQVQAAAVPQMVTASLFRANPNAGRGRMVQAQIERLDNPKSPELGWVPIDGGVQLASYTSLIAPDELFWRGRLTLPKSFRDGSSEHRLVLREFELFETDDDTADLSLSLINASGRALRSRMAYAEIIPLTSPG